MPVDIRLLAEDDSISELTQLLHRADRPLAERGMRYVASWQDDQITRKRIARGECYLAFAGGRLAGHGGQDDDLRLFHQPTPARRNARLSRAISRAITRRWTSCVPS